MEPPELQAKEICRMTSLPPMAVIGYLISNDSIALPVDLDGLDKTEWLKQIKSPLPSKRADRTRASIEAEGQRYERRPQFPKGSARPKTIRKRAEARIIAEQTEEIKLRLVSQKPTSATQAEMKIAKPAKEPPDPLVRNIETDIRKLSLCKPINLPELIAWILKWQQLGIVPFVNSECSIFLPPENGVLSIDWNPNKYKAITMRKNLSRELSLMERIASLTEVNTVLFRFISDQDLEFIYRPSGLLDSFLTPKQISKKSQYLSQQLAISCLQTEVVSYAFPGNQSPANLENLFGFIEYITFLAPREKTAIAIIPFSLILEDEETRQAFLLTFSRIQSLFKSGNYPIAMDVFQRDLAFRSAKNKNLGISEDPKRDWSMTVDNFAMYAAEGVAESIFLRKIWQRLSPQGLPSPAKTIPPIIIQNEPPVTIKRWELYEKIFEIPLLLLRPNK